jgi:hypothetical protein
VTLVDRIKILYFLEDFAQARFIRALVKRVAKEESIPLNKLDHDIRSVRGRVIKEFKIFLKDIAKTGRGELDILIVAKDGNCKGYNEQVKQLEKSIKPNHPIQDKIVYAIPDPHIERWYIIDQKAFKKGVEIEKAPELPQYKCRRDYYKQVLNRVLKESNINSLFDGKEYAEKIVENIENLEILCTQYADFQSFIKELRRKFKSIDGATYNSL